MKTFCSLIIIGFLVVSSFAQETIPPKQSNVGFGMNLGLQKPFCDVQHTGAGLAGEAMMRYLFNRRVGFSLGLGYGLLNDGFVKNTFQTNMITGDVKFFLNLLTGGAFVPYLSVGAGVYNFQYNRKEPYAIGTSNIDGRRFYDGSYIVGGGFELFTSPQFSLHALADYRFGTGDDLDGYDHGKSTDGYANGRIGFTYYLEKRPSQAETRDELIALQRAEYGEAGESSEGNLSNFEAKIDNLETSDASYSMDQYVRLKSRVDELNALIDGKDHELNDLTSSLEFKNQRIVDLESNISKGPAELSSNSSGNFTVQYEEALKIFYAHDYQNAIRSLNALKAQYPNHQLLGNCNYWLGECYFALGNYAQAADAFQSVFNFDSSQKKDDATLMLGRCYFQLNDRTKARSYFQSLLENYPDSEYTDKAKAWLDKIG